MKTIFKTLLLMAVLISMAACGAPRVHLMRGQDNDVAMKDVSGAFHPDKWLDYQNEQDNAKIRHELKQKSLMLIRAGKTEEAKKTLNYLKELESINTDSQSGGYVIATLTNRSSFEFTVLDGPFAGLSLKPGEASESAKKIPIGHLKFNIRWLDKRGKPHEWAVERTIDENTENVILRDGSR